MQMGYDIVLSLRV